MKKQNTPIQEHLQTGAALIFLSVPLLYTWLFSLNPPFLEWTRMGVLVSAGFLLVGTGLLRRDERVIKALILGLVFAGAALWGLLQNPRFDLGFLQAMGLFMVPAAAALLPLKKKWLVWTLKGSLGLQALYMVLQFMDVDPLGLAQLQSGLGGGFLGNANLAALVVGAALLAFAPPWKSGEDEENGERTANWIWFAVLAVGLVASGTLWAQLAFVPVALLSWWRPKGKLLLPAPFWLLLAGLLLSMVVGHPKSPVGEALSARSVGQDPFIRGRVVAWNMSWNMFGENMGTGMGTGAFRENMMGQMIGLDPENRPEGVHDVGQRAHNDALEFAAEYGVVFFLLSLLPWFYVLKRWDRQRPALVFVMLMAMVHFPLHSTAGYWVLAWLGALAGNEEEETVAPSKTWPLWKTSLRGLGLAAAFLALVLVPTRMIAPFFAVERYASILDIQPYGEEVRAWVKKAPWMAQFHQIASHIGLVTGNEQEFSSYAKSWAELEPHNPQPRGKLATFYLAVADYPKAQKYWREVFEIDPHNKTAWMNLAASEAAMGNYGLAVEIFENWSTRDMDEGESNAVKQALSTFRFLELSAAELKNPDLSEEERLELHYRRGESFFQIKLYPLALASFQLIPEDHGRWVPSQARIRQINKMLRGLEKGRALRDVSSSPATPQKPQN